MFNCFLFDLDGDIESVSQIDTSVSLKEKVRFFPLYNTTLNYVKYFDVFVRW
jgi:hypothetical protein